MAMNNETNAQSKREDIEMLLPFYVTGRLDHADADRIGDYLSRHPEVARELELVRDERESTIANNAIYADRPVRSFDRVAAMIRKTPARTARPAGQWLDRIREFLRMPSSPALGWMGAAAAIVILLQAATIGTLVVAQYRGTFTGASGGNEATDIGTTVVVRFADGASASTIADALEGLGLKIVDGPRGGRLFTVRLGPKGMDSGERDRLIAALRARGDVVAFVTQMP
jgi:anti-sigma factor RsiW